MYNKFSKGESIKTIINTDGVKSHFPAKEFMELWANDESKRYEILERPIRNLFQNNLEDRAFTSMLLKGLKIGKAYDETTSKNSILYGCELFANVINTINYITVKPGLFIYKEEVYEIYPSCYKASRQLEKSANLDTENGLEYINIKFEDNKFSADINLYDRVLNETVLYNTALFDRGIDLLNDIITYMVGKTKHKDSELIALSDFVGKENYQLEPVFISNSISKHVAFDGINLISEASLTGENLSFGTMLNVTLNMNEVIKWDGFTTNIIKEDSITNAKLKDMAPNTIKGNDDLTSDNPDDLGKDRVVNMFNLVTQTNENQSIDGEKTFIGEIRVDNDKKLVFKKPSATSGWSIKSNADSSLSLTQDSNDVKILSIENTSGISTFSKAVKLTDTTPSTIATTGALIVSGGVGIGGALNIAGNTSISGTTKSTGDFTVGSNVLTVASLSGNTNIKGTVNVEKTFTVNTDKFSVNSLNGNTSVAGTLNTSGITTINNTTTSSSKDNGSLVVKGGVGVSKDVNIGGTLKSLGSFDVGNNNFTVDALSGDTNTKGNLDVDRNLNVDGTYSLTGNMTTSGTVKINSTAISSNPSTGALVVEGGVGIKDDLYVGGDIGVTGIIVNGEDLAVNGGDITSTSSSFNLLNQPATVNAFTGASTSLTLGSVSGTSSLQGTTVKLPNATTFEINGTNPVVTSSSNGALKLFNSSLDSVDAFGSMNTINLGTKNSASTFNISTGAISTGTKSINIGTGSATGSITNIVIGSLNGTSSITMNKDVTVSGDLSVNGGDITSTSSSFNLLNQPATVNAFSASTTLNIGALTGTASLRNLTIKLPNATSLLIGETAGSGDISLSSNKTGTLNLFNSGLTVINAFGGAITTNISGTNVNSTVNIAHGITSSANTKTVNIGTNGATSSTTQINIGSSVTGATSNVLLNKDVTVSGDLSVNGGDITSTSSSFNLLNEPTTVNAFSASTTLNIGASATTNQTVNIGTSVTGAQIINIGNSGSANSTLNINHTADSSGTATGSVVISGGVGINKKLYVGSDLSVGGSSSITGALTLSGNLTITTDKFTVIASSGNTETKGTLKVGGILTVGNNKFTVAPATGNITSSGTLSITGGSTLTGAITNTGGISTQGNISAAGSISSDSTITAGTNIISTTGNLILKKRNFLIGLGNPAGTTYDWSIGKTSTTEIGSLEIKNSGNPSNGTFSIDNTGLVKALKFQTNGNYTLNNLNVEKFNGHTIVNTLSTSSVPSSSDMILWEGSAGTEIKRVTFTNLPQATYTGNDVGGNPEGINGLMTPLNLKRISNLEEMAGWSEVGGTKKLVGTVNGEEADSSGGNVLLDTTHIHMSGSTGETVSARLSSNAAELKRLATQVPENSTHNPTENQVIISTAGTKPVWGKITDDQIDATIKKVSPNSQNVLSRTLEDNEIPVALWENNSVNSLYRHNDVIYDTYSNTLMATNVSSRSSIKYKEDVEKYTISAFDTLSKIDIVKFHFKSDESKNDKIGFIAENSPVLVAGEEHDKMDMGNCIGLLIKAVQELKQENEELRRLLNGSST